jgi:hypothetical protein
VQPQPRPAKDSALFPISILRVPSDLVLQDLHKRAQAKVHQVGLLAMVAPVEVFSGSAHCIRAIEVQSEH